MVHVPATLDEIDAAWCTRTLTSAFPGRVVEVSWRALGQGQVGSCGVLALVWDPPDAGPASMVVKTAATSSRRRRTAAVFRAHEVEVGFYRDLAPRLGVRTPRCWFAGHHAGSGDFCLLLEHVREASGGGDRAADCTPDQALLAVEELARLHGDSVDLGVGPAVGLGVGLAASGSPTRSPGPWLRPALGDDLLAVVPGCTARFLRRWSDRLSPEAVQLIERFASAAAGYGAGASTPVALIHGDYRRENLLFAGVAGVAAERVVVVDWQTAALGHALADLSYLLGTSLDPADRGAAERDLVTAYHRGLVSRGLGVTWRQCWDDYRRFAFGGIVMAVIASALLPSGLRSDEVFLTMARRSARQAVELGALGLLSS